LDFQTPQVPVLLAEFDLRLSFLGPEIGFFVSGFILDG
jgi:hypothetical protein